MSDEINLRKARLIASKEADAALRERRKRIGSGREAVPAFHTQILALREADRSWEEVAEALHRWCGLKLSANTVKAYTSKVNMGELEPWPHDDGAEVEIQQAPWPPVVEAKAAAEPALLPPDTHKDQRATPVEAEQREKNVGGDAGSTSLSSGRTGREPGAFYVKPDPILKRT